MQTLSIEVCRKCIYNHFARRLPVGDNSEYQYIQDNHPKRFDDWFEENLEVVANTGMGYVGCFLLANKYRYKDIFSSYYHVTEDYGLYYDYLMIDDIPPTCPYILEHVISERHEKEHVVSVE
jgi:hypothetical protein